jgi:hypothetical protein
MRGKRGYAYQEILQPLMRAQCRRKRGQPMVHLIFVPERVIA